MAERMLKFTTLPQKTPTKRAVSARREDFSEIYEEFQAPQAADQASRCSQCGIPFCSVNCPLGNNIPDWLKLTTEGRLEEAYELAAATNTFPEICGRICPQDRLCEGNCVIEKGFESVTIGAVERYITDTAFDKGWVKPIRPAQERPESIGIIGAGPAGLAAAEALRSRGYKVTIYDRHDRVGGLMIYGIPGFKLEKEIVLRRWKWLEDGGIKFVLNADIGGAMPFAELRAAHDAVLVATGKDVVVIGGGDTAMDCVRTAVRQQAKSVTCLYRRDKQNMPGSLREVTNAEDEGVVFTWLSAPEAFLGEGMVTGVRAIRMHLGLPDASGRQSVDPIEGSSFTINADLVIKALGFDPEDLPGAFNEPGLRLTGWGTLKTNPRTFETALPGVYAAGDIVRGASLVVWAIRDGRDAAAAIHHQFAHAVKAQAAE
jgi:glutamate synthase (NADPH/NADH) small chain